jgi:hypothetical protein
MYRSMKLILRSNIVEDGQAQNEQRLQIQKPEREARVSAAAVATCKQKEVPAVQARDEDGDCRVTELLVTTLLLESRR